MEGKILNRNYLGKLVKNAGKKLELNGFTGACIQLKGDWEFLDQALRFPRWDNKESMCWLCKASNHGVDLLWTGEGWKTTLQSHEDYVTDRVSKGFPLPVLFLIAALRTEGVMIDSMHAVDQGMACHILANILFDMMRSGAFGGTNIPGQLKGLREALDEWYRRNKGRYRIQGKLTIDRIKTSSDWPKLKAKAAATRHLAFSAGRCWTNMVLRGIRHNSGLITNEFRVFANCCAAIMRFCRSSHAFCRMQLSRSFAIYRCTYVKYTSTCLGKPWISSNDFGKWQPKFIFLNIFVKIRCRGGTLFSGGVIPTKTSRKLWRRSLSPVTFHQWITWRFTSGSSMCSTEDCTSSWKFICSHTNIKKQRRARNMKRYTKNAKRNTKLENLINHECETEIMIERHTERMTEKHLYKQREKCSRQNIGYGWKRLEPLRAFKWSWAFKGL